MRSCGITRSIATTLCGHKILRTRCHQIQSLRAACEWEIYFGSHSLLKARWVACSRCKGCLHLHAMLIKFGLVHHVGCAGHACMIHWRGSCLAMATHASRGTHVCCHDLYGALHLPGILVAVAVHTPWTRNLEVRILRTSSSSARA